MSVLSEMVKAHERSVRQTEEDLVREARSLIASMERLVGNIEGGFHINDLGEVQSQGPKIDRLCALRQERVNQLHELRFAASKVDIATEALAAANNKKEN